MLLPIYASSSKHLRSSARLDTVNCARMSHIAQVNSTNGWIADKTPICFLKSVPIFHAHHIIQNGINGSAEVVKATGNRIYPLIYIVIRRVRVHV